MHRHRYRHSHRQGYRHIHACTYSSSSCVCTGQGPVSCTILLCPVYIIRSKHWNRTKVTRIHSSHHAVALLCCYVTITNYQVTSQGRHMADGWLPMIFDTGISPHLSVWQHTYDHDMHFYSSSLPANIQLMPHRRHARFLFRKLYYYVYIYIYI